MPEARFVFLLHSHMPYVRRNGDWPCGEEWILEAWAESYLPIWQLIDDLSARKGAGRLALTLTPVLAEQLEDEYLQERLSAYLANKVRQAQEEVGRWKGRGEADRAKVAVWYEQRYTNLLKSYEERFRGRMVRTLAEGMAAGKLEVLASAATHAHLPSLDNEACRRAQVRIGLESYKSSFQREPSGFWLPECSYTPDLDGLLSEFSPPLRYVILDHNAALSAPESASSWEPRRLGDTPLVALMRDKLAHEMVWTMQGIPSHGSYRDYSKRDHKGYGMQYWQITSTRTPIENKELYDPSAAERQALKDAGEFTGRLLKEAEGLNEEPVILACYDTELLGHWWLEGPQWLREVLRLFGDACSLPDEVARKAAAGNPAPLTPRLTAWNVEDGFNTWVNEATAGLWQKVYAAEERFLKRVDVEEGDPEKVRALMQAGRELLIMEASDWAYMITRDQAAGYARERFASHLERFEAAMKMTDGHGIDISLLSQLEETDNLFPRLHPGLWR